MRKKKSERTEERRERERTQERLTRSTRKGRLSPASIVRSTWNSLPSQSRINLTGSLAPRLILEGSSEKGEDGDG